MITRQTPTRARYLPAVAILALATLACLLPAVPTHAQSGGGYDLSWNTTDGPGAITRGAGYALVASVGQPEAGDSTGGDYALTGGFLAAPLFPGPTLPGDCNADGKVGAGDLSALVLEIFDGDGSAAADAPGGTYAGDPVGCDANGDALIGAGDLSCAVLIVFNGAGACN